MKKIFVLILSMFIVMFPMFLSAEARSMNLEEALKDEGIEPKFDKLIEDEKQVDITFFRKKGDEKCIDFLNYLNDHYDEYGVFFNLVSYEISENEDNLELMNNVLDYLSAQVEKPPFMVIGEVYFSTYNESMNNNFISTLLSYYDSQDKTNKVEEVLVRYYRNDNLIIGISIGIIVIIAGLIIYASRKK